MELEERLIEALARAMAAEKIADRALALAQEAFIQLQMLKERQATGGYYPVPDDMGLDGLSPIAEQPHADNAATSADPSAPPIRPKLSPFNLNGAASGDEKQSVDAGMWDLSFGGKEV